MAIFSQSQNQYNQELSPEFRFFSFNKIEKLDDLIRPSPESFLSVFAPHKLETLRSALRKIKFKFKGEFIADLTMPMNIGGYFSPDAKVLAINPVLLLEGSEKEIAHVLFHEGLHAGVYSEGVNIMEEVVVETMTKKKITEVYGGTEFQSGYDEMVKEAADFFGELSYQEMTDRIEDGDEETFNNYLELAVVKPAMRDHDAHGLNWKEIHRVLGKKWGMLKRLFPRMINSVADNNAGLHDDAHMEAYEYKLEGLLNRCAETLISERQDLIVEIFMRVTKDGDMIVNLAEMRKLLMRDGYSYLIDKEPEVLEKMMNMFLLQVEMARFNKKEIKASEISIEVG